MNHPDTSSLPQTAVATPNTEGMAPAHRLSEGDLAILRAALTGTAKEREVDVLGWYQALPQLLAGGEEGRFALVHEGQVVSVWDTYGDAMQAGLEKYGPEQRFWAGEIKQQHLDKLERLLAQQRA
jgi:hypothetical protein